ncbi:MAG: spermidine/putrescine ABC transporter substrate-binding protein [Candidatus Babeliales bacterium]
MNNQTPATATFWLRFISKISIIIFYLSLILTALYLPHLLEFIAPQKSLTVYAFTEMVSPAVAKEFEAKTGVPVNIKYFQTNEELHAKLSISKGSGYDVIVASDYIIESLIKEELLLPLERNKISNVPQLDQNLMNHFFDPNNRYSLPLAWYTYGIVFDKSLLTHADTVIDLELLFNNPVDTFGRGITTNPYKICMFDDPREAIMFASLYLFGTVKKASPQDFELMEKTLITQKKWIESYTSSSLQYFLFSGLCPVAITSSSYMKKILKISDRFGFQIPLQGSILVIDNLCISAQSRNTELAHQFINFVLSKDSAIANSSTYGYNSSNVQAYQAADKAFLDNPHFFPNQEMFKKLHILRQEYFPKEVIEKIWLSVKFA